MDWKLLILILMTVQHIYRLVLHVVENRSAGRHTPANVADVYDAETYERWKRYSAEKGRLGLVSTVISWVMMLVLLCTDAYAAMAGLFPTGVFMQLLAVLLLHALVEALVNAGLNYVSTMVIEEKYGFNRSTMKTFVADQIRNLLLELLLSVGLIWILSGLHRGLGDWMILLFAGVVFCITLLISFLYPIFSRIGNKFVPLEEGELRDKLMALLNKHGYQVKAIEVMDASRRTTKLNAYFTGFGKMKTIVLYDNLVNTMSTDEICAVFAHELGHGLHKDVLKQQIMNFGNLLLMAVVVWLAVREPMLHEAFGFTQVNYGFAHELGHGLHKDVLKQQIMNFGNLLLMAVVVWLAVREPLLHESFGFAQVNYGFAYILLGVGLGLVQPLTGMAMSAYSRFAEYRADRQAVEEGYGEALVKGLKILAKENFVHLAPARLLVVLEYSHPPLSERITAIEKTITEKVSKLD